MPLLPPSVSAYAGLYGPISLCAGSPYLSPLNGTVITVYESDGSTVPELFTDETKSTSTGSNQVTADTYGRIYFYANPGLYVLSFSVGGSTTTQTITVQPWYADATWNVVEDTLSESANPGDCRLANAGSGAITETLSNPALGARYKIIKADTSANVVTVSASSGVIGGVGFGGGVSSIPLGVPGAFVEIFADGANYHITGGQRDTGWQPITEFNANASASGDTPQYRIVADECQLRGTVNINGNIAATGAICTLPAIGFPLVNVQGFNSIYNGPTSVTPLIVNTAGAISVPSGGTSLDEGDTITLDTVRFYLD